MAIEGRLGNYTVEQRVLIHLFEHPLNRSQWDGKREQTQAGISMAVGVARKHLPRTLKSLISQDLVSIETRHVPGAKQRCRVYYLTNSGRDAAKPMRDNIASISIKTVDGELTIGDVAGHEIPYLQVLSNIDSDWNYNPSMIESTDEEDDSTTELYRKVLHGAWKDGKISQDEGKMLEDIAIQLGLEPDVVETIEKEVMEERSSSKDIQKNTFLEVLSVAWQDGYISEDEQAMLDSLSQSLGLDSNYTMQIQKEWIADNS
tara:strand:- start:2383 stop:3162 length:780 start_codon:yes stop_codon:yes gene_type:complete